MSFAPAPLKALVTYLATASGQPTSQFGVVGDTAHTAKGTSYHLGADHLVATAYSRQTARDKAGLTDAASAIDIKFGTDYVLLRRLSVWLVAQGQANAAGTSDMREVIYSPDGKVVLRWDRERGYASAPRPGEADASHLWHSHVSFYRDSEARDKIAAFRRFFEGGNMPGFKAVSPSIGRFTFNGAHALISPLDPKIHYMQAAGASFDVFASLDLKTSDGKPVDIDGKSPPLNGRDQVYLLDAAGFGIGAYALRQDGVYTAAAGGDVAAATLAGRRFEWDHQNANATATNPPATVVLAPKP